MVGLSLMRKPGVRGQGNGWARDGGKRVVS